MFLAKAFFKIGILTVFSSIFFTCISAEISKDVMTIDYCKKLKKHVRILKEFNKLNKENKIVDLSSYDGFLNSVKSIEYQNEIIKLCVEKMIEFSSIEPLLKTWTYACDIKISNNDIVFVREFSMLIFSLYESLLVLMTTQMLQRDSSSQIKGPLADIIEVYNTVSDLPLKEILITLEKCYVIFSKILKDYGAFSKMSFKQWVYKYWWLPPTIIVAIIAALFKKKISKSRLSRF